MVVQNSVKFSSLLSKLPALISCCSHQVHTFYEAVGYMIGAQTDQTVQEHLIEKYMLLPNQVWDSIIQQATKVSSFILSVFCVQVKKTC